MVRYLGTQPPTAALGLVSTEQRTAIAEQTLDDGEDTTGWVRVGSYTGPTLDNTVYRVGAGAVKFELGTHLATNSAYVDLPSAVNVGGHDRVVVSLRYRRTSGSALGLGRIFRLKVADATGLSGNVAISDLPATAPQQAWLTIAVNVASLSQVRSIGLVADAGALEGAGRRHELWFDDVKFAAVTELDDALADAATVAAVAPTDYAPSVAQDTRPYDRNKVTVDLRPGRAWVTGWDSTRHARDINAPSDGLTPADDAFSVLIGDAPPKTRVLLEPDGVYWVESPLSFRDLRDVEIDGQGASVITRAWFGLGSGNAANLTQWVDCYRLSVRNINWYGYKDEQANGSALANVAGSPTVVSTTKTLAPGDGVAWSSTAQVYSRMPRVAYPDAARHLAGYDARTAIATYDDDFKIGNCFEVVLSATASATVELRYVDQTQDRAQKDSDNAGVFAAREVAATTSQQRFVFPWEPTDLTRAVTLEVHNTSGAETVTVHSMIVYGRTGYSTSHDLSNTMKVDGCVQVKIRDMLFEGSATDPLDIGGASDTVELANVLVRGANRQGLSCNRARNVEFHDITIVGTGRSGIDVEPYGATDWQVRQMRISRVNLYRITNYALACGNDHRIFDLHVSDVFHDGFGLGCLFGGSTGGSINNVRSLGGEFSVDGTGMIISNVQSPRIELNGIGNTLIGGRGHGDQFETAVRVGGTDNHVLGYSNARDWSSTVAPTDVDSFETVQVLAAAVRPRLASVDTGVLGALYGNSYPGLASQGLWFPDGLNMHREPLTNVGGFGGSGTNFAGLRATCTASTTTVAVQFPARGLTVAALGTGGGWPKAVTHASGGISSGTTYYYRVGVGHYRGGAVTWRAESSVTVTSPNNAVEFNNSGFDQPANGLLLPTFVVLRGTSAGVYTSRAAIKPTTALGARRRKNYKPHDVGATIIPTSDASYPASVTWESGSWSAADESGWEPDTNYEVAIFGLDWDGGQPYITAKTRQGFTVEFPNAPSGSNGVFSWMLVRNG